MRVAARPDTSHGKLMRELPYTCLSFSETVPKLMGAKMGATKMITRDNASDTASPRQCPQTARTREF